MAGRVPRLTERFARAREALRIEPSSPDGRAVTIVIRALASASVLPGPGDVEATIPPTTVAFVRRVQGRNLWVWYRFTTDVVNIVGLSASPPVPLDP